MIGCCFSLFFGWVLVDVIQALTLQKVVAKLVLWPRGLQLLCSGGSVARQGSRFVSREETFCSRPSPEALSVVTDEEAEDQRCQGAAAAEGRHDVSLCGGSRAADRSDSRD